MSPRCKAHRSLRRDAYSERTQQADEEQRRRWGLESDRYNVYSGS